MCLTLALMLVVVPKVLMNWNFKLQAKDDRGVVVDNYEVMHRYLQHELNQEAIDHMVVSLKQAEELQKGNEAVHEEEE